jgi:hypothetical protein
MNLSEYRRKLSLPNIKVLSQNLPKEKGKTKNCQSQLLMFWPQFELAVFQMEVRNLNAFASVSQPLIYGGTPKIIFHIPSNPYLLRKPLQVRKIW